MYQLSVLFHRQNHVSVLRNFNFQPRYLGKCLFCLYNQPHFLRNSDKSLFYLPSKTILKKSETWLCREKTAEDSNTKINFFPNIPCTFLLFKASAFLQVFFLRNLLFRQVLRKSVFLNSKCLKISNKRTYIPSFINQFIYFIELRMQRLIHY